MPQKVRIEYQIDGQLLCAVVPVDAATVFGPGWTLELTTLGMQDFLRGEEMLGHKQVRSLKRLFTREEALREFKQR